jgi:C4-type Zn-finger protein
MEFCTRCRTVRNMRVSVSLRKLPDSKGNIKEIVTKSYHCESCGSFVRSEDIIMNQKKNPDDLIELQDVNTEI